MNGTCYMNGSEWPHCCCPLANNVEYIDRGQAWAYPKMPLPAGGTESPANRWFIGPKTASRSVHRFCRTHRHTDRPRYSVGNNRTHLVLSTRCVLITSSCCSTDSERPYRCCHCHLPNKFGSRPIFHMLHNKPGDAPPQLALFWGNLGPTCIWFIEPT